eukprot:s1080_g10.t1
MRAWGHVLLLGSKEGHSMAGWITAGWALAEDLEESGGGCRYFHSEACGVEPFPSFFEEWRKKTECWLCNNQELVLKSRDVLKDFLYTERPEIPVLGQEMELHDIWKESCLAGFLLALFSTTRSQSVQPWKFYDVGLSLINSCAYDEARFFARYGITTAQVAYNFYILGLPYHLPDPVLHLQASETSPSSSLRALEDAPLVIDIGMGLGADSRYYLSQGFRVVAVEANRKAIEVAMTIDWVQPLVLEGRLTFLHAAIAGVGQGGSRSTIFAFEERPEQSNAQPWVEDFGGKAESVRTVECADLLRVFGYAVYMKIDVESSTIDCLDSLAESQSEGNRSPVPLPKFLSMELEAASLFERFYENLQRMGYLFYKACRQYIYSPAPCEQGRYSREVDVQNVVVCVLDPEAHDACDVPVRRRSHSSHSSQGAMPLTEEGPRVPGDSSSPLKLKNRSGTANVFNEEVMTQAALRIATTTTCFSLATVITCCLWPAPDYNRERVQADTFMRAWDPPPSECSHAGCKLWGHLAAHQPRHWLLRGPDLVRLLPGQVLQVVEVEQHGIGVVVRNAAGQLSWALEGYVVNVAGYEPRTMPTLREYLRNEGIEELIDQDFQEAKPYGMFDKPHVLLSTALLIPVLGLNITGWMVFSHASFGGLEFFRGLFLFIVCLPIYRFGSSFWGEAYAGHYTSWRFHVVLTACAATVSMSLPWFFRLLGLGIPSTMMMVSGLE